MIDFTRMSVEDLVEQAAITGVIEAIRHTPGAESELPRIADAIRDAALREATMTDLQEAIVAHRPPDDDLLNIIM